MASVTKKRIWRDWDEVMADFRDSGISITEYCGKHNISQGLFGKWYKRLGEANDKDQCQSQRSLDFVRVDVPRSHQALTIRFAGDVEIAVSNDCDVKILSAVIAQLKGVAC